MSCEGVTILIVDDEAVVREAVQRSLQRYASHATVHCASNGREALALLRGVEGTPPLPRPVVVLTDLNMPVMGGFDFIDALREDPSHRDTAVFVMTASASDESRAAARRRMVAGYTEKGSSADALEGLAALVVSRCASLDGR